MCSMVCYIESVVRNMTKNNQESYDNVQKVLNGITSKIEPILYIMCKIQLNALYS